MTTQLDEMLAELFRRVRTLETTPQTGISQIDNDIILTGQATASATYVDLATPGPICQVNITASGLLLVLWRASFAPSSGTAAMAIDLSGANTVAAVDDVAAASNGALIFGISHLFTGLTPGPTTVTAKYRSTGAVSCTFSRREVIAIPI